MYNEQGARPAALLTALDLNSSGVALCARSLGDEIGRIDRAMTSDEKVETPLSRQVDGQCRLIFGAVVVQKGLARFAGQLPDQRQFVDSGVAQEGRNVDLVAISS